jgi:hypothetical protein
MVEVAPVGMVVLIQLLLVAMEDMEVANQREVVEGG